MTSLKRPLVIITAIAVAIVLVTVVIISFYGAWYDEWSGYNDSALLGDGACNIAVIPLVGEITAYDGGTYEEVDFEDLSLVSADQVIAKLREAEANDQIDGVVVQIDSGGGGPVASEMLANTLKRLDVPSVALIRELGASGGYLTATGADTIIASAFSDVGGIGVTMSYLDNSQQNLNEGLEYVQLTSAKFKDYGSPDRPMTAEERALLQRDLDLWHREFVDQVASNRNLPVEQVEKLADGSTLPGELALTAGLVDELGDAESARQWFVKTLDMPDADVALCE
ncbi:MAG: signal peptide peptidase SppA [Patescibacteria group bacterium]